jgi:hypothetical protein
VGFIHQFHEVPSGAKAWVDVEEVLDTVTMIRVLLDPLANTWWELTSADVLPDCQPRAP